jgi:hypothetical protein
MHGKQRNTGGETRRIFFRGIVVTMEVCRRTDSAVSMCKAVAHSGESSSLHLPPCPRESEPAPYPRPFPHPRGAPNQKPSSLSRNSCTGM